MTGGVDGWRTLSSTEIYRNKAWTVLSSAALPSPSYLLSAGNIDNTIFAFGKTLQLCDVVIFFFKAEIHPELFVSSRWHYNCWNPEV